MINQYVLEKLEYSKILKYIANYTVTEKGKSNVLSTVPFDEEYKAIEAGKLVTEAKEILIKNYPPIEYIPDLSDAIAQTKIEGTFLDGKKIWEVYRLASISRNLFQFLKSFSEEAPGLAIKSNELFVDKVFEHHIQRVVTETGDIKENASPKLSEIRSEIRKKKDDLVKTVNRLVKKLNEEDIVREDYLTLRDGRIVIPVKAEHKRHIRGFIHSESSTGQTVYIEPEQTLELNNEIISLSFAERREIERLLKELTKKIGSVSSELKLTLEKITYFDAIFAKAKYSIEIVGSFPDNEKDKPFSLIDARHPLLVKKLGRKETIPLNTKINKDNIILITGPNAGGKTVVLKTVGLLAALVKSGIHIPAEADSNVPVFNDILLDIGDQQSIEDDLSTFSSHLTNIKNIIKNADKNSLVLLDEIGTGTDPTEGSALAAAVLIKLKEIGSIVFATTHHGDLKLIANDLEGFENAAMEFDNENLKPTYNFKQGIPGSSYAFEIAKRIGLSDDFLDLAKEYLNSDKHQVETFLVEIEAKSKSLEEKLKKLEIENSRLHGLSNLYQQNVEKLNKEKKDILRNAKSEADIYLKNINKKFEQVVKDLKEQKADKETVRQSKKILDELKETNKNLFMEDPEVIEDYHFRVGDFASIKNTAASGEIIDIDTAKNKAAIDVGGLKMKVKLNDLIPSKKEKKKIDDVQSFAYNDTKIRLDIRGERPEDAEFIIIKFLDEAYTSNLNRVEILHGKGTGALKRTVKQILKSHEKVRDFYFAPIEFGGEGITIAELK